MLNPALATAIAEAYGLGDSAVLLGPVAAGRVGQVWRLSSSSGVFAVKDPFFEVSAAQAASDAVFQDLVRAAGVPMPAVVRTPAGQVMTTVEGHPVRVYEWVDLLGPTRRLAPGVVGALLASIHRVVVPMAAAEASPWHTEPIGVEGWTQLVVALEAAGAPFADQLAALVPQLLAVEALITPPSYTQLSHCDLWSDNLLPTPTGGVMVLDWENSGAADPSQELGMVVFEYGCGEPQRMNELYAAYVGAGGPGRLRAPGDLTMLIANLGHIAEEGCRRWLAAGTDEARADNAAWVAEFLDDPVTVSTVEGILAGVLG